jgi:membrane peptidoglycan carboxypeptidase
VAITFIARLGKVRSSLLRWIFFALVTFYGVCLLTLFSLNFVSPPSTSVQLQRRLEAVFTARPYSEDSLFVPLRRIDPHLVHAVVAAEDARFFTHRGIDWVELQKVLASSWRQGRFVRGGSTITQQLVKNLFRLRSYCSPKSVFWNSTSTSSNGDLECMEPSLRHAIITASQPPTSAVDTPRAWLPASLLRARVGRSAWTI